MTIVAQQQQTNQGLFLEGVILFFIRDLGCTSIYCLLSYPLRSLYNGGLHQTGMLTEYEVTSIQKLPVAQINCIFMLQDQIIFKLPFPVFVDMHAKIHVNIKHMIVPIILHKICGAKSILQKFKSAKSGNCEK